jgi:hypothetical protein
MSIASLRLINPFLAHPCLVHRGDVRCLCSFVSFALPFSFSLLLPRATRLAWAIATGGMRYNAQYSPNIEE